MSNVQPVANVAIPLKGTTTPAVMATGGSNANYSLPIVPSTSSWAWSKTPDQLIDHLKPPPPKTDASTPAPPDFEEELQDTIRSLSVYKTFPVDNASTEFHAIAELMAPYNVASIQHVVNPELWQRYKTARKEMIRSKTDDMELLSRLGFDKKDVWQRAYYSGNFDKDPIFEADSTRYSTNEALLFHCTRGKDNLEKILNEGLDERIVSSVNGGLCGKGIYFADDPVKSAAYDGTGGTMLVFAVLLGDCLAAHGRTHSFLREPEKERKQQRNFTDRFFDSIVAKPMGHNEFVIYNRNFCYPMYMVKYKSGPSPEESTPAKPTENMRFHRSYIPTIAWNPMPNQYPDGNWPFYAASLFEKVKPVVSITSPSVALPISNSAASSASSSVSQSQSSDTVGVNDDELEEKIQTVWSILGIEDEARIKAALMANHLDLDLAMSFLLDHSEPEPSPSGSSNSPEETTSGSKMEVEVAAKFDKTKPLDQKTSTSSPSCQWDVADPNSITPQNTKDDCPICCNEYPASDFSPQHWKKLPCECGGHQLCVSCYEKMETSGRTVSGKPHTSIKCPFCQKITGTLIGDCPMGEMKVSVQRESCEGYPDCSSIEIEYILQPPNQQQTRRVAYLPNNTEGKHVRHLLTIAWDRRLTFTIGRSHTTGEEEVPVWNIHHKTALSGGVECHGFPDPGYIDRVKDELKAFGIE